MAELQPSSSSPPQPTREPEPRSGARAAVRRHAAAVARHSRWVALGMIRGAVVAAILLYFAFAGTILVLRYAILPNIDDYRADIENGAAKALGLRVTLADVDAAWDGLRPQLTLKDVTVYDRAGRPALQLPRVVATLAWESVTSVDLRLHSLQVIQADLHIRRDRGGRLSIAGLDFDPDQHTGDGGADWVLAQSEIQIRDASIHWSDELRGAPELSLEHAGFVLRRFATRHRFALVATPPGALAAPIDVRGYFDHDLFGAASDVSNWRGEVYANLGFIDLAGWHAYLDYPADFRQGTGSVRAWLKFSAQQKRNGRLTRLPDFVADVRLNQVTARLAPDLPELDLGSLSGRIGASQTADTDTVTLRQLSLSTADGKTLAATDLDARRSIDAGGKTTRGSVTANRIDLQTIAELGERLPLSAGVRKLLNQYQPRGVVSDIAVQWRGNIDAPDTYTAKLAFQDLAMAAQPAPDAGDAAHHPDGQPGFDRLSGTLSASETGGTLTLASRDGTLTFPGVFGDPQIAFRKIDLQADWTAHDKDLEVRVASLHFDNPDATGDATALYRRGPASGSSGPGYLELNGKLTHAEGARVPRYLPQTIPEETRSYLQRAIQSGVSDDTSFHVKGLLEHFPFPTPSVTTATAQMPSANPSGKSITQSLRDLAHRTATPTTGGEFRIVSRLHGVRFDFAPPPEGDARAESLWPALEDIDADLIFDRSRMEILARSARVYGVKLEKIRAELPDLDDRNHVLHITGGGTGPLQDLVRYVNASPVNGWIDRFTEKTRATGNATLDLKLDLPLSHMDASKVSGGIQFAGNDVTLNGAIPTIARAQGRIEFSDSGMALRGITGQFLGGPMKLDGATRPDGLIELRGEGTANAQAMRRTADTPLLQRLAERLDGTAKYNVSINLRARSAADGDARLPDNRPALLIESTLAGLAVDLPAPLKKAAAESWPLRIESVTPAGVKSGEVEEMRVRLDNSVTPAAVPLASAIFEHKRNAAGDMPVTRVAYGINEPATLIDARSYASVSLPTLDIDAWQATAKQIIGPASPIAAEAAAPAATASGNASATAPAATPSAAAADSVLIPDTFSLHATELRVSGKSFGNVVLAGTHTNSLWQANVDSDQISGHITWRDGGAVGAEQNRITARLARLIVPQSVTSDVNNLLDSSPSEIPALDIVADNFTLRDKKLGRLELVAFNANTGGKREWRLQKLLMSNPDGSLDAKGTWGPDTPGGAPHTRLNLSLKAGNVGRLLDRLGMTGTVKDGTALLEGDVDWRGSPLTIDYGSLDGHLRLEADKGQFLKADPGIAKLLGVLSLQGLPRRITLDFRDVFSEGFAFDSIRANANLDNGIAATKDFKMRGVAATVLIEGSADLARETQNLNVLVLPEINAGAGSLAYALLANPAIGLATFLAQVVLKDPLSKAFSFEYNVTGAWADPTITKLGRKDVPASVIPRESPAKSPEPVPPQAPLSERKPAPAA